ncbi:hypothetical protein [Paenibacillus silvisoli]|uniref:hypothetical protein n=1 Tax=Paenibacillus silvisoli TaxID=3110539 RepID=UPI0028046176|nr:hypothetical protein [Paenibacillus silvisoli]
MPFTSGLVHNNLPAPASNVVVNARNIGITTAVVVIEIYVVSPITNTLSILHINGYELPGKSSNTNVFFIGGNIAYEVQLSMTGLLSEVVFTAFGVDVHGSSVEGQQILANDWQPITALSMAP